MFRELKSHPDSFKRSAFHYNWIYIKILLANTLDNKALNKPTISKNKCSNCPKSEKTKQNIIIFQTHLYKENSALHNTSTNLI